MCKKKNFLSGMRTMCYIRLPGRLYPLHQWRSLRAAQTAAGPGRNTGLCLPALPSVSAAAFSAPAYGWGVLHAGCVWAGVGRSAGCSGRLPASSFCLVFPKEASFVGLGERLRRWVPRPMAGLCWWGLPGPVRACLCCTVAERQ